MDKTNQEEIPYMCVKDISFQRPLWDAINRLVEASTPGSKNIIRREKEVALINSLIEGAVRTGISLSLSRTQSDSVGTADELRGINRELELRLRAHKDRIARLEEQYEDLRWKLAAEKQIGEDRLEQEREIHTAEVDSLKAQIQALQCDRDRLDWIEERRTAGISRIWIDEARELEGRVGFRINARS